MEAVGPATSIIAKPKKPSRQRKEPAQASLPRSSLGLITLYEPPQPTVDFCFVHGLRGHATNAWTVLDVCWPRDLLPSELPNARVLTFGYSALNRDDTPLSIKDLGKTLLESLSINRRHDKAATRPLIFVAHSFGGLLVKSALVYSHALDAVDKDSCQVFKATIGCVFFGTPHVKLGRSSWAQTSSQISRALAAQSPLTTQLSDSVLGLVEPEDMVQLSSAFVHRARQLRSVSCVETLTTSTNRGKLLIVPHEDAVMGLRGEVVIPLEADHMAMTKFTSNNDPAYHQVVQAVIGILASKPKKMLNLTMIDEHGPAAFGDQQLKVEDDGPDLVEYERRFLANLRSDWLDDVMITDNTPQTCEWVLASQPFKAWLSEVEPTLRILGGPGMGKTVLAKFLYRQLREAFSDSTGSFPTHRPQWASEDSIQPSRPRHVLAYFFDMKTSSRNNRLIVLQSLLYQILSKEQELFKYIHGKPIFTQPQRSKFGQYVEILKEILYDPTLHGTIIILDALDECDEEYRQPILEVLSALDEQSRTQLLITSRSEWDFKPYLTMDSNDSIKHVNLDIEKYVQTAVKEHADAGGFSPDLESYIISKILQQSFGNFLWVHLVLQNVSKARTVHMVRRVLEQLPTNLKESYSFALSRATGFTGSNMRRALYFVMVAKGPLRVREISALLALTQCWENQGSTLLDRSKAADVSMSFSLKEITENQTMNLERDLESHFQPLLSVKESSLSLVHFTLREFLEQEAAIKIRATFNFPQLNRYQLGLSDVHTMVAILCLQYMLASFHGKHDPLGFLNFACLYWTEHARESRGALTWLLEDMLKVLFRDNSDFTSIWLGFVSNATTVPFALLPKSADLPCVLAAFNLVSVFGTTFKISILHLESINQDRQTPLHFAAANNAISTARWLQRLYDIAGKDFRNLTSMKDINGQSPFSLAAQNGHDEMMKLLLTSTGSIHIFELMLFETIADTGNREMFETLYDQTEFVHSDQRLSLLTSAIKIDSVDLIKEIYTEYTGQGNPIGTAAAIHGTDSDPLLHVALRSHAYQAFDFLLDMRGYCDAIDKHGNTVLHVAAQEGAVEPARKLLTAGNAVDAINERGETPLHVASSIGLSAMIRLLCDNNADVNMPGPFGCSSAHLAIKTGHKEVIDILFEYGSNVFATDNNGRSALHAAAELGQEAILAALLDHGAHVNAEDFRGRTSVHYAAQSANLSILYVLFLVGADPSALDLEDTSPLHVAAKQGSDIIVRELLCLGSDPDPQDKKGRTPLHYGCLAKRPARTVVETLLEAGADVNKQDQDGLSSLHDACLSEYIGENIVRLLLRSGADINQPSHDGKFPLHYAI